MDTKQIGIWSFLLGIILSLAAAFFSLGAWASQVILLLGILVGAIHPIKKDLKTLGIAYLALTAAAHALNSLYAVGPYVTLIVQAAAAFLGPVVLTAFLLWGMPYLITMKKPT